MSERYRWLGIGHPISIGTTDDGRAFIEVGGHEGHVPAAERVKAAQALAGDGYEVVEKIAEWERDLLERQRDDTEDMQRDLERILAALGLGTHARPISPHQVVIGEVLPAIGRLKAAEPADVAKAKAEALREAADAIRTTEILFRRHDESGVTVNDLLREMAARYDPPEPDPEQVEALRELLSIIGSPTVGKERSALAEYLVRNGVTVGEPR